MKGLNKIFVTTNEGMWVKDLKDVFRAAKRGSWSADCRFGDIKLNIEQKHVTRVVGILVGQRVSVFVVSGTCFSFSSFDDPRVSIIIITLMRCLTFLQLIHFAMPRIAKPKGLHPSNYEDPRLSAYDICFVLLYDIFVIHLRLPEPNLNDTFLTLMNHRERQNSVYYSDKRLYQGGKVYSYFFINARWNFSKAPTYSSTPGHKHVNR